MLLQSSIRYLVMFLVTGGIGLARGEEKPRCPMSPAHLRLQLPASGFIWLEDETNAGRCEMAEVAPEKWTRKRAGQVDLLVSADGPSGSGRFWNLMIAVAKGQGGKRLRGVCVTTSTVGWRTLQVYENSPLRWIDDIDGDGKAELIIWESFSLGTKPSIAESGLVAWIYRPTSEGSLLIDWILSRKMAQDLARAYRAPLQAPNLREIRSKVAEALELLANDRCTVEAERTR